jgi:hypothetical protein
MAEFSKQYQEAFDFDWNDFDYQEIFDRLEKNQLYPLICEGLGTLGVAKSDSGEMLLLVQDEEDPEMVICKALPDVIELVKKEWESKTGNASEDKDI